MYYFFFESRSNKKDPVVIWLTGGPGCSSELALFYENGPFSISDNMSLVWNEFVWDNVFFLIFSILWYLVFSKSGVKSSIRRPTYWYWL
ncbi:hypothetical protein ES332_A05G461700v1 [Gossypium tomentosum]|uniref:Uncharacterized protein n=1 Tax=Gossypium tomentosum TaxID=34277 RepID=A0A5D2QWJ5_GOSTO|nr:hypothetical protein ES332_A05G461700v1 [Gossypium tomentosum]